MKRDLPLLSLFCGPGGMDEGFRQAGFSTALAFDIDADCVKTFNKNHSPRKPIAYVKDLTTLHVGDLKSSLDSDFAPIGVIGGPPCQSFSISNVHQAEDDPRHNLPMTYANLLANVNKRKPVSFFVFENVPGLLSARYHDRYTLLKVKLEHAGFEVFEGILDAQEFGVPQRRRRMFLVGINRKIHPEAVFNWPKGDERRITVREAIGHLPEPCFNAKNLDRTRFAVHPNHWAMVPRSQKFKTKGMLVQGQSYGRSFRTLWWDQPSWTVAYGNREIHVHPSGKRRLSIYEAMLLQSFPTHYELTGNISAQARLVSEAVPPKVALELAKAIRSALRF